jgi:hypothetical protein
MDRWSCAEAAGFDDIRRVPFPGRTWTPQARAVADGFVAVMGVHRPGASCLAGVLQHLGVHLGGPPGGFEPTARFEDAGLAALCEEAYPFPGTKLEVPRAQLLYRLRSHVERMTIEAARAGKVAGGKYPQLCAMGPLLAQACGRGLRIVAIDRPLQECIDSLKVRSRFPEAWLCASDADAHAVQAWLDRERRAFLATHDHVVVGYGDLCAHPRREIERLASALRLAPTDDQVEAACGHVRPDLRHRHCGSPAGLV